MSDWLDVLRKAIEGGAFERPPNGCGCSACDADWGPAALARAESLIERRIDREDARALAKRIYEDRGSDRYDVRTYNAAVWLREAAARRELFSGGKR